MVLFHICVVAWFELSDCTGASGHKVHLGYYYIRPQTEQKKQSCASMTDLVKSIDDCYKIELNQ